jgi:hypothetical protein
VNKEEIGAKFEQLKVGCEQDPSSLELAGG